MTTVRTLAAHEIVQSVHPHPITEADELGVVVGRTIDHVLSRYSHDVRSGRRPTASAVQRLAETTLDEELEDADLALALAEREQQLAQIAGVLQAFRRSEVAGMLRPRSRLVLINERAGYYAQPDYWNGKDRFYEMKSYRVPPIPPGVELQLKLFQLAFPRFAAILASYERRAVPVATQLTEIPPLEPVEEERLLRLVLPLCEEKGQPKVLEYVDAPVVRYSVAA